MKPNKQMRAAIMAGKASLRRAAENKCVACNGTGHYDSAGNPKCVACNGTGSVKPGLKYP